MKEKKRIQQILIWLSGLNPFARIGIFLAIVLPVFIIATTNYYRTEKDLNEYTFSRRHTIAQFAAIALEEKLDHLKDIGTSLASRVHFRELIARGHWSDAIKIMDDVSKTFPIIDRIFIADVEGNLQADAPALPNVRGKNFKYRDWYKGVTKEWKPYISNVYKRDAEPRYNIIAIAIPIQNEIQQNVGILVLQVIINRPFNWAKNIEIGPSGYIYIVDKNGNIVFHPKYSEQDNIPNYSSIPVVKKVLEGKRGVEISFNPIEKEERISAYEPVPEYGWGVIAQQPTITAFALQASNLKGLLIVNGSIFIITCVLAFIILWIISQVKQSEIKIIRARFDQKAAENLAERKTKFLDIAAHELRTPITIISLMLQNAEKQTIRGQPLAVDVLARLKAPVDRLTRLVIDLLDMSRLERKLLVLLPIKTDIVSLIIECVEEFRIQIQNRKIIFNRPSHPLEVNIDPVRIHQVLTNLLDNAIKYTSDTIEVTLEVRTNAIRVSVIDHGIGIPKDQQAMLFKAVSRGSSDATSRASGLGLGLSICRGIMELHIGTIGFVSEEGIGSTFHFELPYLPESLNTKSLRTTR